VSIAKTPAVTIEIKIKISDIWNEIQWISGPQKKVDYMITKTLKTSNLMAKNEGLRVIRQIDGIDSG